jgi:hypothetical protein
MLALVLAPVADSMFIRPATKYTHSRSRPART